MDWIDLCVKVKEIETLLSNHIHWHETFERYFILPMFVGVMLLTFKEVIAWIRAWKGGKTK